jgi:hypothetical protein
MKVEAIDLEGNQDFENALNILHLVKCVQNVRLLRHLLQFLFK